MHGWMRWLLKREWLVIIVGVVIFLRIPTLLEPYWYGDEGIYLTVGKALNNGAQLYRDIHDNKPPLLYLVAAIANGTLFWYRFIAAGWNIGAVIIFALLARKVFPNRKAAYVVAAWIFALLTNIPLWEGNIGNAENFFLLPTVLAAYLLVSIPVTNWKIRVFGAGLLFGLAALFKMPAILELGVWPLVWLATNEREKIHKTILLGLGAAIPIILSVAYFASQGVLNQYLIAAGVQNVPYLATWQSGIGNVIDLKMRVVIAAISIAIIWGLTGRLGRTLGWIGMWGIVAAFAALLSGRPYPHYLLQTAPVAAMAAGMVWEKKMVFRKFGIGILLTLVVICGAFAFWKYPVVEYYVNYVRWVTGYTNKEAYYGWFNPQVNNNYKIAETIRLYSSKSDKIFVWGDEPAIYAMADRMPAVKYAAKYHILDFRAQAATLERLERYNPQIVVSFGREEDLPGLVTLLDSKYKPIRRFGDGVVYIRGRNDW